jgi:hypothetical protein
MVEQNPVWYLNAVFYEVYLRAWGRDLYAQ